MTSTTERDALAWLREAAASGDVHTVRLGWTDRLGTLRGKRLPVDLFLDSPDRRISFCDGMIVVDVNCDVHQGTPFSNFDTGYPDMYLSPSLDTIGRIGWAEGEAIVTGVLESHSGEPLAVAPANVLSRVLDRLGAAGIEVESRLTVCGRLMRDRGEPFRLQPDGVGAGEEGPGILRLALDGLRRSGVGVRSLETDPAGGFRLSLDWSDPVGSVRHAALVKAALKELARTRGIDAVFMTVLPGAPGPSLLQTELRVKGTGPGEDDLTARLREVRAALQPSINAFKAGPTALAIRSAGETALLDLSASSEADPATALMAVCAAIGAGAEGAVNSGSDEPRSLLDAADLIDGSAWVREWLGDGFIDNMLPLLRDEVEMFNSSVTDWELNRYWGQA